MTPMEQQQIIQQFNTGMKIAVTRKSIGTFQGYIHITKEPDYLFDFKEFRYEAISIRPFEFDEIPVGKLVISQKSYVVSLIVRKQKDMSGKIVIYIGAASHSPETLLREYTFEDGSPCGVKV